MTITQIHNTIEGYFTGLSISFMHGRRPDVNTQPIADSSFTYPLAVMDPITYTSSVSGIQNNSRTYQVNLAILDLLGQDSTPATELAVVTAMDAHAAKLIYSMRENSNLSTNFDTAVISDVEVQTVFWYRDSGDNLSGVVLSFTIEAIDTFDYCASTVDPLPGGPTVGGTCVIGAG